MKQQFLAHSCRKGTTSRRKKTQHTQDLESLLQRKIRMSVTKIRTSVTKIRTSVTESSFQILATKQLPPRLNFEDEEALAILLHFPPHGLSPSD
ncbi:hypothetical protein AV530_020109 [Patagioenas fasciata monilis]|uniref:Uncharacterized protein n=1 Tax=Patagioenas fasciata monilis TaxID=372326 RepID=A0A1V4JID4_PATFA|nr:hypothetical protein AV530_020109 [Patagioenas fasciata monilis]